MRQVDGGPIWYQGLLTRYHRASPALQTILFILPVLAIASLLRVPGTLLDPPGFRHDEATVAMAAQQVERGHVPIYFLQGNETIEPAFVHAVAITGRLAGWGVEGPRLAAALLGVAAAVGCSLWYRRTLGPGWGLIGGVLVAASFWQLAFSHQAVPSIAMAAVGGFGLWALAVAAERRPGPGRVRMPSAWFGIAGLLFGIGFYTDVAMRAILPLAVLFGIVLARERRRLRPAVDRRGLLLGLAVMLLVAAPLATWFWQEPESFRQSIDNLGGRESVLSTVGDTLAAVVVRGEDNPQHTFSRRPLLDPFLGIWLIAGLIVSLRRPVQSAASIALIWFGGFLAIVMLIAPGSHAQLLALTPVLFYFPLRAMRAVQAVAREHVRIPQQLVPALLAISLAGSVIWSSASYVQWIGSDETYHAFAGDVREATEAVANLPPDNLLVYFATGEHGRIVRYLAPDRPRRDFAGADVLLLPARGPAWIIIPDSALIPVSLTGYLHEETLLNPDGTARYRIWLVDDRTREQLPYVAPVIHFAGGPALVGYDIAPAPGSEGEPAVEIVQVYQVTPGGQDFQSLARLVGLTGQVSGPDGPWVQPGPERIVRSDEFILARVLMPFPEMHVMIADLQTGVRLDDGEFLEHNGPEDSPFTLLNIIGYIGPQR